MPFEEKPHVLALTGGTSPPPTTPRGGTKRARRVSDGGWFGPYRAQRISELLEAREVHDAESLLAIQMDPGSAFVDRNIHHAVAAFRSAGLDDLATRLEGWDRQADLESTEATLFQSWWSSLHRAFREHYYGGGGVYFPDRILEEALEEAAGLPRGSGLPQSELPSRTSLSVESPRETTAGCGPGGLRIRRHPLG